MKHANFDLPVFYFRFFFFYFFFFSKKLFTFWQPLDAHHSTFAWYTTLSHCMYSDPCASESESHFFFFFFFFQHQYFHIQFIKTRFEFSFASNFNQRSICCVAVRDVRSWVLMIWIRWCLISLLLYIKVAIYWMWNCCWRNMRCNF